MFIYYFPVILCFSVFLIPSVRSNYRAYCLVLLVIWIISCFGYMTGSDWRAYEVWYDQINLSRLYEDDYNSEPSYYILMVLFRSLDFSFWPFFITLKSILFLIIGLFIWRYASEYSLLAWVWFLPKSGYALFVDNPMRNLIAICLFLISIKYLLDNRKVFYILINILALTFHFSAFIAFIFFFFINRKISVKGWVLSFIIVYAFIGNPSVLDYILQRFVGITDHLSAKIYNYTLGLDDSSESYSFSLGMIVQILIFFSCIIFKESLYKMKNGVFIFNSVMTYVLLFRLGSTLGVLNRFQLYLVVPYSIGVAFLAVSMLRRKRMVSYGFLFILSLIMMRSSLKIGTEEEFKYIPYTNYMTYVLSGDQPSYEYRSSYNYKH